MGEQMGSDGGERCQCCGCQYLTVWWCGDRDNGALWAQVYEQATGQRRGEAGLLCPQCADKAARELGITLHWVAMTYWAKTTELEQAREESESRGTALVAATERADRLEKERDDARKVVRCAARYVRDMCPAVGHEARIGLIYLNEQLVALADAPAEEPTRPPGDAS